MFRAEDTNWRENTGFDLVATFRRGRNERSLIERNMVLIERKGRRSQDTLEGAAMQGVYNHPRGRYPGRSYRKAGRYGVCVVCKVKGGMMGDCDGDEISGKCPEAKERGLAEINGAPHFGSSSSTLDRVGSLGTVTTSRAVSRVPEGGKLGPGIEKGSARLAHGIRFHDGFVMYSTTSRKLPCYSATSQSVMHCWSWLE